MLELHAVQAEFGDCLLLRYGTPAAPRHLLIDGGPRDTYRRHLQRVLEDITAAGGHLDALLLSHVDGDHAQGLVELLLELRRERQAGEPPTVRIDQVWHNSFEAALDDGAGIQARLAGLAGAPSTLAAAELAGIADGNRIRVECLHLGLPLNPGFPGGLVELDTAPAPIRFGNLELVVVGPSRANLEELEREWHEWLDAREDAIASGDPNVLANSDRSVPNLSSIQLLARADGRTLLLTGDGRSDHLLQGLDHAGLLDGQGRLHVDVLKLPHHGSDRNITRTFFRRVTADRYVISANGKDDNPDLATLIWLVEEAREAGRRPDILATNRTHSTRKLEQEYPPAEYGYRLQFLAQGAHVLPVPLTP